MPHSSVKWTPFLRFLWGAAWMGIALMALSTWADKPSDEVIAAVLANWPPQYITNPKTGAPAGFAIDVFNEVARRADVKVRYQVYDSWPEIQDAIRNDQAALVPNMGIIPERADLYNFTTPVEAFHIRTFVRKSTTHIQSVDDLAGQKVGVVQANKGLFLMQERGGSELVIYNSLEEAFFALLAAHVEALVYPEPPLMELAYQSNLDDRIKAVGEPLLEVKRAIAVSTRYPELFTKLNQAVEEFVPTEAYQQIYQKWYQTPEPYWGAKRVLIVMLAVLFGMMVIMVLWHYQSLFRLNRQLREQILVRQTTEEELQKAREELEQRVAYRTSELSAVNAQLTEEIEERKRIEERLQRAKEAALEAQRTSETANRIKTEFLANMSHELRTPLNGILGYAQILKRGKELTSRQREHIDGVERSGQHLLTLINDLLDLSKIEAGRLEMTPVTFNFRTFLRDIIEMIRIRAEQQRIAFFTELDEGLPMAVSGDHVRLRQILLNLLGNAVKFTEQGSVSLRVHELSESHGSGNSPTHQLTNSSTHKFRFEISDTGIGIPPERLETIFQPFEHMQEGRFQSTGTGLGLPISQRLAQMLGSCIQLESEAGKGSRFWFDLELQVIDGNQANDQISPRKIVGFEGSARKVLIVDDEPDNLLVLRDLLEPLGFAITEASNGRVALQTAIETHPDLILMDLRLPEMDGFEVTRHIRSTPALHDVIVIAVSASAYRQIREKSAAVGCNAFLPKPIRTETLFATIGRLLSIAWRYETPTPVIPPVVPEPSQQMLPPLSELQRLSEIVKRGMVLELRSWLDRIEQLDERYRPFTTSLRRLSKQFAFKEIQQLVTRALEDYHDR